MMKIGKNDIRLVIAQSMLAHMPLLFDNGMGRSLRHNHSDVKPNRKRKMFKINQRKQRKARNCKVK